MAILTTAKLAAILPSIKTPDLWVAALQPALDGYQITTKARLAAFLAQVGHESGDFNTLSENLNYSAAGLRKTFPTRFTTDALAEAYARQPEKIANFVYASRLGNGPTASGDGWKYRGRGLIQTTGKTNYDETGDAIGIDLVGAPDRLAQDKVVAAKAAAYFWKSRGLNALADDNAGDDIAGDFLKITKKINGGTIGHAHRVALWQKARQVL